MPMKCMAQMPKPMAKPPPTSQARAASSVATRMRSASVSAVYEARIATRSDISTRLEW